LKEGGIMIDQLRIGNRYSYDEFEASVSTRKIGSPTKKSIKDTVPFSNITHDFSKINGEIYWGERSLEYVFEIDADTPHELEEKKIAFSSWIMNVFKEELYDPFIEGFHFLATFESIDFDDSEVEKTTATVTFSAYPFMIADLKTTSQFQVTTSEQVVRVSNASSHKITPTVIATVPVSLKHKETTYSINEGTTTNEALKLDVGVNEFTIKGTSGAGTLKFEFFEEVF
jgi:hypothetical protein